MINVAVIGLGFVGLTTALGLSDKGIIVKGFDVDANKQKILADGDLPFHEPHLKEALAHHIGKGFQLTNDFATTILESQIIFYCVGTPAKEDGSTDLSHLLKAIGDTVSIIREHPQLESKTLVIKSTVPPTTTRDQISTFIDKLGLKVGDSILLSNNPEFLREGYAWNDFMNPDRIVIGCEDQISKERLTALYKSFAAPIHFVTFNEAEFIKYLSNTLLSTLISYANEMSMLADKFTDINISRAFKILHQDKRWYGNPANMATYVYPGCGFGGYCLPKDSAALYNQGLLSGYDASLIKATLEVNEKIAAHVVDKIKQHVDKETALGILGLSFKPQSDDIRETPARNIISMLLKNGYKNIFAYDPLANKNFIKSTQFPIQYAETLEEIKAKATCVVILTAWEMFKECCDWSTHKILDFRYYVFT